MKRHPILLIISSFIIYTLIIGAFNACTQDEAKEQTKLQPQSQQNNHWPMFHNEPGLSGALDLELPNALKLRWTFKTKDMIKSSPAIGDGRVFIGSYDGHLYALDIKTGKEIWRFFCEDGVESSPCLLEDVVYFGACDAHLYALEAKTGKLIWKYETGDKILGGVNWARIEGEERVRLLVGSYDSCVHCVDSTNGKKIWIYESDHFINGMPAVKDGLAVFGGCDAHVHIVSAETGKAQAKVEAGAPIAGAPAMDQDQIFVGHYEGELLCLGAANQEPAIANPELETAKQDPDTENTEPTAATHKILWRYEGEGAFFSTPALSKDYLYVGSRDQNIHCINRKTGEKVWTFQTQEEVDSSPILCKDKLLVGSCDGRFYMISADNGEEIWSYEIGQPITASPGVGGGKVIIGAEDGVVYAFEPDNNPASKPAKKTGRTTG